MILIILFDFPAILGAISRFSGPQAWEPYMTEIPSLFFLNGLIGAVGFRMCKWQQGHFWFSFGRKDPMWNELRDVAQIFEHLLNFRVFALFLLCLKLLFLCHNCRYFRRNILDWTHFAGPQKFVHLSVEFVEIFVGALHPVGRWFTTVQNLFSLLRIRSQNWIRNGQRFRMRLLNLEDFTGIFQTIHLEEGALVTGFERAVQFETAGLYVSAWAIFFSDLVLSGLLSNLLLKLEHMAVVTSVRNFAIIFLIKF